MTSADEQLKNRLYAIAKFLFKALWFTCKLSILVIIYIFSENENLSNNDDDDYDDARLKDHEHPIDGNWHV